MIPERNEYNLSHKSVSTLKLGRLQTITRLAVLPADTFMGKVGILARVSPFERVLLADLTYDIYAFFQPWRDYYEGFDLSTTNRWKRFILDQGRTGNSSLSTFVDSNSSDRRYPYLQISGGSFRKDIPWTYYRMLETAFEHPDVGAHLMLNQPNAPYVKNMPKTGRDADTEASVDPFSVVTPDKPTRWWGERVMKPRTLYTSLRKFRLGVRPQKALTVSAGKVTVDLATLGFEGMKARRLTQQNVVNRRANLQTFLNSVYGVAPRDWNSAIPELLAHQRGKARVSDVISQGDDRLGQKVSHAVAYLELDIPPVSSLNTVGFGSSLFSAQSLSFVTRVIVLTTKLAMVSFSLTLSFSAKVRMLSLVLI